MKKRELPISAIIVLSLSVWALIFMLVFPHFVALAGCVYICLFSDVDLFSITTAQALFVSVIVIAVSIVFSAIPIVLRLYASDKVYGISKKICDLFLTFNIVPWAIMAACAPIFGVTLYAWEWCTKHGGEPFKMLMLLIPVLFLLFVKIKFRIPRMLGNVTLAVYLFIYFRFLIGLLSESEFLQEAVSNELLIAFCAFSFVLLWLFEQTLRDSEGRLNILSCILLTSIATVSALYLVAVVVNHAYEIYVYGALWKNINSMLFATPVCALFIAYIIKINFLPAATVNEKEGNSV